MWMLLAVVTGTFAILLVIVLATPFDMEVSAVKAADDPAVRVQVRMQWLGFRLPVPGHDADRARKKTRPKAGRRQVSIRWSTLKAVMTSPGFLRRVVRLARDEIRLTRPRRVHLHARLGFDDPSDTGMLLGWAYALRGLPESPAVNIGIEPDFTNEVAAGELRVWWSRRLGAFVWPVVTFGLSPVVWRGLWAAWRQSRRVHAW